MSAQGPVLDAERLCAPDDSGPLIRGSRMLVLVSYCAAAFLIVSSVVSYGVCGAVLRDSLNLTETQASFITAVPVLASVGLRIPVTLVARMIGGRLVGAVLAGLSCTGLATTAALFQWVSPLDSSVYGVFVLAGLLIGCGSATINSGIVQCSSWWPIEHQGAVAGVFLCMATLGSAVFGAFAAPMIDATGVASLFLLWALCVFAGGVALLVFAFDPPAVQADRQRRREEAAAARSVVSSQCHEEEQSQRVAGEEAAVACTSPPLLLALPKEEKRRRFLQEWRKSVTSGHSWCLISIASVTLGCYLSVLVWIVTFFVQVFETSQEKAGFILFGFGVVSSAARVPAGLVIDRTSPWRFMAVTLVLGCAGFLCLMLSSLLVLSIAAAMVVAVATAGSNTCCYKLAMLQCPDSISGTIGLMETLGSLLGFALPLLFGAIAASPSLTLSTSVRIGMIVPCVLMLLSLLPLFLTYRFRSAKRDEMAIPLNHMTG